MAGTTTQMYITLSDVLDASTTYPFKVTFSSYEPLEPYLLKAPTNLNMHINENIVVAMPPIMNDDG